MSGKQPWNAKVFHLHSIFAILPQMYFLWLTELSFSQATKVYSLLCHHPNFFSLAVTQQVTLIEVYSIVISVPEYVFTWETKSPTCTFDEALLWQSKIQDTLTGTMIWSLWAKDLSWINDEKEKNCLHHHPVQWLQL